MISVEEATSIIQSNLFTPQINQISLDDSIGCVLAEDIYADRDFPPFNRVAMDGIAINYKTFEAGRREYKIENTQYAGAQQLQLSNAENCMEVMTGAMLPMNTDCVIRFEDIEISEGTARIVINEIKANQNVHQQASDASKDELLIPKNRLISPAEIGVLATVGKSEVNIYTPIKTAIVSTGDELVKVEETPKDYQIRRSNSHVLKSALGQLKIEADIYHIHDEPDVLKSKLSKILEEYDVVILSGGVSKGKKDFVPAILEDLGVNKLFHRVAQKPGKPFWFGKSSTTTVFALPGNPVSTFLCFNKYIEPWINLSLGVSTQKITTILDSPITFKAPITYFAQVKTEYRYGHLVAKPVLGAGSGDLGNLLAADGFIELPADQDEFKKGESYDLILYRSIS